MILNVQPGQARETLGVLRESLRQNGGIGIGGNLEY